MRQFAAWVDAMLADLIGAGEGVCLDLCCGTGARAGPRADLGVPDLFGFLAERPEEGAQ